MASLWGRHQSSWDWYHSIVLASPSSKSVVGRRPAELGAELGGVDGVAQVVPGAIGDEVEVVGSAAEVLQDAAHDVEVVALAVGADQVGLADPSLLEDRASTAEEWSSAWIQSRTLVPAP